MTYKKTEFRAVAVVTALNIYMSALAHYKSFAVQTAPEAVKARYKLEFEAAETAFESEYNEKWQARYGNSEETK